METYKALRPTKLADVAGQPDAVSQLQGFFLTNTLPHALLFAGPSGSGKTTLARIVAKQLGSGPMDIMEINAASDNGVDVVRDLQSKLHQRSLSGAPKVVIWDECHSITTQAQQALLKMLEECPSHTYFMLCTSEPTKVIKAVQSRLTKITLTSLGIVAMKGVLAAAEAHTGKPLSVEVKQKLLAAAEGNARKLLVMYDQCLTGDASKLIAGVTDIQEQTPECIDLVKLIYNQNASWSSITKALEDRKSVV